MQMFFWHLKHLYFDNTKPSELDWLLQVISTRFESVVAQWYPLKLIHCKAVLARSVYKWMTIPNTRRLADPSMSRRLSRRSRLTNEHFW